MAWVTKGWGRELELIPHKTDLNCFRVIKIRQPVTCMGCGRKIPKRSYAYGSDWTRLCLRCGDKFSHKAIKKFEEVIDHIKCGQQDLIINKDKWESENALALL